MSLTVLNVAYPPAPVGPDAVGGAEQILSRLDEALVRAGHTSVVVACGGQACGTLLPTGSVIREFSNNSRRAAWERHRHVVRYALRRWAVDVVHMHGVDFHAYLPSEGTPVLATLHLPPSRYPRAVFQSERPDTFLQCVSESERRSCPNFLNGTPVLPTIENGVPVHELFRPHTKRDFALALGRICPEKGFHHALDAAERAQAPLLIAGEVFGYRAHRTYFDEAIAPRLNRKHRYVGPIGFAGKRRLLSSARCLLVPSLEPETSSLVAMESLACGTPVVAFPNGALTEIIEHGRTGFIVQNSAEMAEAIHAAATLDSESCRAAARKRFSADRMTHEYLALYARLARKNPAATRAEERDILRAA